MMNKSLLGALALSLSTTVFAGPFAPAAGTAGSTAISATSTDFVAWATGYMNYLPGTDVDATWQTPYKGLGKAGDSGNVGAHDYTYDIVSLGNGGAITLTFGRPIADGAGYDFAVFENSFSSTFLELAWVEVSSNGSDFFRFTNYSLTPKAVGAFGAVDPTNIDGLAGKYQGGYGTQFDLSTLVANAALDLNNISFVRLVDIIGDGSAKDSAGRTIFDPHKTVGSGGFDLDAIGVLHQAALVPTTPPVPVPAAAWLFGSALSALVIRRRVA